MSTATPTQTVITPRLVTTIAGRPVRALSFDAQHSVDQPIGTATITLALPLAPQLQGADGNLLNQEVRVQAGFEEGDIRIVFWGRIDADRMEIDERALTATISARGWGTLLDWQEESDLVFRGPIPLHDIIRSLCRWRGLPAYRVDPILGPSGAVLQLGGNVRVDDGNVIIPRRTSPLTWIARKCELFGYRAYDSPSGVFRVQRIAGTPRDEVDATYAERVNAFRIERSRDLKPMVTYWTVEGPTFTDNDGVQIPIMSQPSSVPHNPLLDPPGYRAANVSDRDLVTNGLATAVRATREIDHRAPYREMRWEAPGDPWRQPGDTIHLRAPTFGVDGRHWLMSVRQRMDSREGYVAEYSAWAGGGSRLPAGDDARFVTLGAGPYHVGDETLHHYAVPAPQGTTVTLAFTVPDLYTSIAVSGWGHGANSFLVDGANSESSVSKLEVWQNGEKVGTAELPVMPEDLLERRNYHEMQHWHRFRLAVPGRLSPGRAELRFIAGEDRTSGIDDFEVRDVVLELRGLWTTVVPTRKGA